MSNSLARGRLRDPNTNLGTDERLNPSLLKALQSLGPMATNNTPPFSSELDSNTVSLEEVSKWVDGQCAMIEGYTTFLYQKFDAPPPPFSANFVETTYETKDIPGPDGNTITLHIHRPSNTPKDAKLPGLIYFHGGAMVFMELKFPLIQRWMKYLAAAGSLIVIGVAFRNACSGTEYHPFPAGLNDCASATQWVYSHKSELGISKIVLNGESGGGNLSLATAIKAKREGWLDQIDGIYAVVPYISGVYNRWSDEEKYKAGLVSLIECDGYVLEKSSSGALARYYDRDEHATNPTAWPFHATLDDIQGFPPTHIVANELDPLRDEGVEFSRKLVKAGVRATAEIKIGLIHGAELMYGPGVIPDDFLNLIAGIKAFAYGL